MTVAGQNSQDRRAERDFQNWKRDVRLDWQPSLEEAVKRRAERIWRDRGGGNSTEQQQLQDRARAERQIMDESRAKP
jgi:hypothetical protein